MRYSERGQSLVEFALMVPLLVLFILGVAEITLFIGTYINVLDLTREGARFASVRDPLKNRINQTCNSSTSLGPNTYCIGGYKYTSENNCGPSNASHPLVYDNSFYYDTACIFSPIQGSTSCSSSTDPFCNGFNSTLFFKPAEDDIVINIFTVTGNVVTSSVGPWSWSANLNPPQNPPNWQKNCDGTSISPAPLAYFNNPTINNYLNQNQNTVPNKGFVTVEAYYCYHQVLKVPLVGLLFPDPMRIHVYTVMPLPAAAPLPTAYPTFTPIP